MYTISNTLSQSPPRPLLVPLFYHPPFPSSPLFCCETLKSTHPQRVEEMDTNAGIEPMRMTEGPSTQTAGGTKPLHRFLRGEPKTVGIVLLFLGLCMFMFGIPLNGDDLDSSTDTYSPYWLGTMYFICGVLYIQSERNITKKIVMHCRLEAVFLFHSLVAGVILISMSVFARLALRSSQTKMLVVMRYPPSAE
ncbi:uncharacterized protein si:ch1073-291c23.2 isoform X2 [Tachysurus fulvidraco]|uniref:uncharacterized protein si:ch1073-291c23.2 isoform X2 n=1 Tax=Tachysurus fulvidraco TaxID=1234273 RepID=UPI001FEE38E5|nr:uncharacterized protein si:ch1073-291c23.2 isoform X2 [Tachysurus fulvidraco]